MNAKILLSIALTLLAGSPVFSKAQTIITNLRTESLQTPIGIDEARPVFSWQMSSDATGAAQSAYRIVVADSIESLSAASLSEISSAAILTDSALLYDSGLVFCDASLGIPYEGKVLRGSTRYYWKVQVLDEQGRALESEPTWFETGLLEQGWSKAEWIGSQEVGASKYRTFFNIDYDLQIARGSTSAVFAYSVKDSANYITATLQLPEKRGESAKFLIDYAVEGELRHQASIDLGSLITPANYHSPHHVQLKVSTPGYHLKSNLSIVFDAQTLIFDPKASKPAQTTISPYPNGEYITDWARLHSIGFLQPKGQKATFSNIRISEDNWKTTLYTDPTPSHTIAGTGELQSWEPYGKVSAPMLRKSVTLPKSIQSARLYVTARGIYEFYINGARVSNDYFNPGWTDYRHRIMYNSYDVTPLLRQGSNALGAMLGSGWYSDLNIFSSGNVDPYGIRQSLLAKLLVRYTDGSSQTIVSDASWKKYDHGPIVRNGFQFGEDYDARKEVDGWKEASFDDSSWPDADIFERPAPTVRIQSYPGLPIQNNITLPAISVTEPTPGTYVYDFGINVVGVPRLEGLKGRRGQRINLRYGEMIYPETIPTAPVPPYTVEMYEAKRGQVYVENYRGAISIDNYIMRGRPEGESYQPIFTDHGFRYLSISGLDAPLPLESVKAVVLESIGEATSHFTSSNADVNQLFQNIQWGQRGNFQSVPTDCPQRDERQGWTGDAQVFARTATYFSPWVGKFYDRWLYSMRDNQNHDGSYFNYYPVTGRPPYGFANDKPGWMGWMEAGIIVPYEVYMQCGDIRLLSRHWDSMVRYMDYLERNALDYIQVPTGIGDHLSIERTDIGLTNTAYYAYDALLMSRMAAALGLQKESRKYARLYDKVKAAFNAKYMAPDGCTVAPYAPLFPSRDPAAPKPGSLIPVDTQTSYALPLRFGVIDEQHKEQAVQKLADNIARHGNTLTTGFIGTPHLNMVLSENGRDDLAYTLFEQTKYPSWLYPVLQGATTMWERWNSYTIENGFGPVEMNSYNHYAYGAIAEWMYAHLLGIERDIEAPAYKRIILQPKIGGSLQHASGGFQTPYGELSSAWEKTPQGYIYRANIPANTSATLKLQVSSAASIRILKGSGGVGEFHSEEGKQVASLKSGEYEFEISLK